MQVFIVWKGHRDYEENVVVCATEELAEGFLVEHGVELRHSPGSEHTFAGARDELQDAEHVPWGIEPCEFRGLLPTGSSAGPKARTTDPGTSKAAALANKPRAGSQRARLLETIRFHSVSAPGPDQRNGLTAEEASKLTGIRLNSASTRMSELMRGGWIAESGRTRATEAGEQAIIYVATEKAHQAHV